MSDPCFDSICKERIPLFPKRSTSRHDTLAFFLTCCIAVAGVVVPKVSAQTLDTLLLHQPRNGYVYFRNPNITMQAARVVNPAPGYLRQVRIGLGGDSPRGTARLRVFGHEGGIGAPYFENDLIEPIRLNKTRAGFESLIVTLPQPVFVGNNQFFIAVDELDSGVVLLSDQVEKSPFCSSGNDALYFQAIRENESGWRWEKYSYAFDVVMEYPENQPRYGMGNLAQGLGITDTVLHNRSIAWGDFDKDSYLDLLWDGRLYRNNKGEGFERVDSELGLHGAPMANLFLDVNNDGSLDILFLGSNDTTDRRSFLFLGSGGMDFHEIPLDLPELVNPTGVSIADITGDGYLDMFIGQSNGHTPPAPRSNRLLINLSGKGFADASDRIAGLNHDSISLTYGSQFVDPDRDGILDLYVARRYPSRSLLLRNNGEGYFTAPSGGGDLYDLGPGAGGDWKDFDNDGDLDLLYPRLMHSYLRKFRGEAGSAILTQNGEKGLREITSVGQVVPEYEERHVGGVWGDVDNDGLLDAFFTTYGDCSFADLYVQAADHSFTQRTFEHGLHWSSAGEDAVWVDFDNDGWLDLCAIEWNQLRLYRNPGDGQPDRYVEIDAVKGNGAHDPGAVVTVYAGGMRIERDVTLGRGHLMGDPTRLHFGLGGASSIDSVAVRWSDGTKEVFDGVEPGTIGRLVKGSSQREESFAEARISAVPNPFSEQLYLHYFVPEAGFVRVEIYDGSGKLIAVPMEGSIPAGKHETVWRTTDAEGDRMPGGVYIYRLVLPNAEVTGRAVLAR